MEIFPSSESADAESGYKYSVMGDAAIGGRTDDTVLGLRARHCAFLLLCYPLL